MKRRKEVAVLIVLLLVLSVLLVCSCSNQPTGLRYDNDIEVPFYNEK